MHQLMQRGKTGEMPPKEKEGQKVMTKAKRRKQCVGEESAYGQGQKKNVLGQK